VREPESIIEEIKRIQKFRKIQTISFEDDIYGLDQKWLDELDSLYTQEVNLPFYALSRFEIITKDFVRQLKGMGGLGIAVGLETGNEVLRNYMLQKNLSNEKIFEGSDILNSEKMPFNTYIMFGIPGENLEDAYESLDINFKIKANIAFTQLFQPYPGTKFWKEGKGVEEAIISKNFSRFKINYPYNKNYLKIQRMQKLAMFTVSHPWLRPFVPELIKLPLDKKYDQFSNWSWKNIYDKQKRMGFKTKS